MTERSFDGQTETGASPAPVAIPVVKPEEPKAKLTRSYVWDIPTRLFHWLLTGAVMVGWYLGNYRSFSTIDYHFYLGYFVAFLLVFRLVWGLAGPASARFSHIVPTFAETADYLRSIARREPSGTAGHNPLGGLSVIALLLLLSVQVISGSFAEDDGLFASGPLASSVDSSWVLYANQVHYYASRLLLFFVGLHIAAIVFYHVWKRENLIGAMVTGWKMVKRS